jgi:hypothetical protein
MLGVSPRQILLAMTVLAGNVCLAIHPVHQQRVIHLQETGDVILSQKDRTLRIVLGLGHTDVATGGTVNERSFGWHWVALAMPVFFHDDCYSLKCHISLLSR